MRHGGHSRAAGFTVQTTRLGEFSAALQEVAQSALVAHEQLRPTLDVDAVITFDDINWNLLEQFARRVPTGQEDAAPLLLCHNVRVRETRLVGQRKHLRLVLDAGQGSLVLDGVAFNQAEWIKHLDEGSRIDIVFHVEANEWQGRRVLQLNIEDLRIAE